VGRVARPESAKAWELRTAWAKRREVVLSLSERCEPQRLQGKVDAVAATDVYVIVAGTHVPMIDVLAIHRPHFDQVADSPRAA
jgi:hypothetical protein